MFNSLLRLPSVLANNGKSRSAFYLDIKNGLCVKPVKISQRAVAWPQNEIQTIIDAQVAGKSADEIKALVASLEAARKVEA